MPLTLGSEQIPLRRDEHGSIRVGQTRVTLESIVFLFQEGASADEIQDAYPSVHLSDVYLVLGYCLRHADEVAEYMAEYQQIAAELQRKLKARVDHQGLRERLLARAPKIGEA